MVHGPQWLRDAYQAICHEINRLDRVIAEMPLNNEDPVRNAPGLCKAYNMLPVTPNEALPHIGRHPRRNAKGDRCNLPALL